MSLKRIHKEAKDMATLGESVSGISAGPINESDIYHWKGSIVGPEGTPYEGGIFYLDIKIPKEYPFKAPKVIFKTPIYHCNIRDNGEICLDILKDQWSPALNIKDLLLSLSSLLNEPNPKDPYVPEIARLYLSNKKEHDAIAKQKTLLYANK